MTASLLTATAGLVSTLAQTLNAEQNEPHYRYLQPEQFGFAPRCTWLAFVLRLSGNKRFSCASCHPLNRGGMDGMAIAVRPSGESGLRNTPTIFNAGLSSTLNWDGVANTLERHTELLLEKRGLMNITWQEVLARLGKDNTYAGEFKAAYRSGLTRSAVLDAIASFEQSLVTPDSRLDLYLQGQPDALNAKEKEGYRLFKAFGCVSCHQGVNVGGNLYQKFGIFEDMMEGTHAMSDQGRFRITKVSRDSYVFRIPSLRNVAVTSPYFHDGREASLRKAVETMAKAQLGRTIGRDEVSRLLKFPADSHRQVPGPDTEGEIGGNPLIWASLS